MIARFIIPNRQKLLPYLLPIDADPTWRERTKAVLIAATTRLCESEVSILLERDFGPLPVNRVSEAYWTVIAEAEASGRLLFDHDVVLSSTTPLAIATDNALPGPSFVRDLITGQHTPAPIYRSPRHTTAVVAVPGSTAATDSIQAEYQLRVALVRAKQTSPDLTWAQLAARFHVTPRKARYFWKEFEEGGEAELRPGQRKCTGLRVEPELRETIDKLWKHSRTFSVRSVYEHPELRRRMREVSAAGGRGQLTYWQLARYVRDVLKSDKTVAAMHVGKKRLPSPDASGLVDELKQVGQPLKVVQVDHTAVDTLLVDSRGESLVRRCYVMYAIDITTRCLWAWRVSLSEPTEYDYLQLVQMGIRPKDDLVAALGTAPYPVHGVPELLVADRGWIYASQNSRARVNAVGITLTHAAPYRPEMKGIVERFIGTINTRFMHRLPGTTKSNPAARGGRDAEREALKHGITVDRFERYLSQAIIDGYSHELHTAIGATPIEQWLRQVGKHGAPRQWPGDEASQLKLKLLGMLDTGQVRTRSSTGYEFDNLTYRPERTDAPRKARIYIDPDDMRSISLVHTEGQMLGCYAGDATVRDLPLDAAIPRAVVPSLLGAALPAGPRSGAERITDVLADAEGIRPRRSGKARISKQLATRAEMAARAGKRNVRGTAVSSETPLLPEPEDDELALEPLWGPA